MPRIGFTKRHYYGQLPPVCRKPPSPGPALPPGYPATKLQCFIHWTDYPPHPPWDSVVLFRLYPEAPAVQYYGESATGADRFTCRFSRIAGTDEWNINIQSHRAVRMTLAAQAQHIYIDPTWRFTTPILHYSGDFNYYEATFQINK